MDIFIDTEFTALRHDAQLLSFGAIGEDGQEFYVELHPIPESACSEFVRQNVLPLFDGGLAICPREHFAQRLATWLQRFHAPRLIADSDWDVYVLQHGLTGQYSRQAGPLDFPGREITDACLQVLPELSLAASSCVAKEIAAHFAADPRQHHALVDARALRRGLVKLRESHRFADELTRA